MNHITGDARVVFRHCPASQIPKGMKLRNAWEPDTPFDVYVVLSASTMLPTGYLEEPIDAFGAGHGRFEEATSFWQETLEEGASRSWFARGLSAIGRFVGLSDSGSSDHKTSSTRDQQQQQQQPESNSPWLRLAELLNDTSTMDESRGVLLWMKQGYRFDGSSTSAGTFLLNVSLPLAVRKENRTVFAHVLLSPSSVSPDPWEDSFDDALVVHWTQPMVQWIKRPKKSELRNLWDDDESSDAQIGDGSEPRQTKPIFGIGRATPTPAPAKPAAPSSEAERLLLQRNGGGGGSAATGDQPGAGADEPTLPHWFPGLHIELVNEQSTLTSGRLPPLHPNFVDVSVDKHVYKPIAWVNEFWTLKEQMITLNESVEAVPVELSFQTVSLMRWQMQLQFESAMNMQQSMGMQEHDDQEELKRMFLDTNPILLGVTMVVSLLHMVFDFLAFRNDISFWRRTRSMEGLSVRTIFMNVFFQVVILLYLWDNDTSWMILISSVVGLAIEVWKLRKAITVSLEWEGTFPRLRWEDKDSYAKTRTREYDEIAMSHLSYAMYPLVIGYAVFSLFYDRHRSWYSWVITSLTGFVYAFGALFLSRLLWLACENDPLLPQRFPFFMTSCFIAGFVLMTPQLFINYKLQSVAHMPWRAMVYKSLNTFVDDLFAFVVRMPTMHRLSCFRDDIIFFIYLYQRWIYPVDKSRKNEFGASAEDYDDAALRSAGVRRECRRGKRDKRPDLPTKN